MSVLPLEREHADRIVNHEIDACAMIGHGFARQLLRVLICNETTLIRDGLRSLLENEPDIEVIATTDSGLHAIILVRMHRPHVVITGAALHTIAGVELVRRLRCEQLDPSPQAIMFITSEDDDTLTDALLAGVSGVLTGETSRDELVTAIRIVASGQAVLAPRITQRLLTWFRMYKPSGQVDSMITGLTQRERQVLLLTARGMSTEEIAAALSITVATVRTHIYRLRNKLQLKDRAQLVSFAYRTGLMSST